LVEKDAPYLCGKHAPDVSGETLLKKEKDRCESTLDFQLRTSKN
jgi:hypothetical protein